MYGSSPVREMCGCCVPFHGGKKVPLERRDFCHAEWLCSYLWRVCPDQEAALICHNHLPDLNEMCGAVPETERFKPVKIQSRGDGETGVT